MTYIDPAEEFRGAERRLKNLLLGDGLYVPGKLKGEEVRLQVIRDLRRMREAFDEVVARRQDDRVEKAEARVADLEKELQRLAALKARRARGVIPPPPEPESGKSSSSSMAKAGQRTSKPRSTQRKKRPASRASKAAPRQRKRRRAG